MTAELTPLLKRMVIEECNVKDVAPAQIGDDDVVIGGQGALRLDSLDAVEIVTSLERHFGIRLESAGDSRKIFRSFNVMSEFITENATPDRLQAFISKHQSQ